MFHHARYWRNKKVHVTTPIVTLEIEQVIALVRHIQQQPITPLDIRNLLYHILQLQDTCQYGPAWYEAYSVLFEKWVNVSKNDATTMQSCDE